MEPGGRLLLRRAEAARWQPVPNEDPVYGGADPIVRGGNARTGGAGQAARLQETPGVVHRHRPDLTENLACMRTEGMGERRLLSIADADQLRSILKFMLDERELL